EVAVLHAHRREAEPLLPDLLLRPGLDPAADLLLTKSKLAWLGPDFTVNVSSDLAPSHQWSRPLTPAATRRAIRRCAILFRLCGRDSLTMRGTSRLVPFCFLPFACFACLLGSEKPFPRRLQPSPKPRPGRRIRAYLVPGSDAGGITESCGWWVEERRRTLGGDS